MLYIVATPIGNLEDITLRALRILREVDVIVCEDTRMTQKLLKYYDISNQLFSWHANSSTRDLGKVLDWLSAGKNIALVTDAGTPGVSDPGMLLVKEVREKLSNVEIHVVPGPSALTAAISSSGVSLSQFVWLGFLPHKKGRQTLFAEIAATDRPVVFYESPHRIMKTLESLSDCCSAKTVVIARELTKIYEEVLTGSPDELLNILNENQEKQKGEFVIIVS